MRIGIAAEHANTANPTGVEHYCQQLILALARLDSKNQYQLYLRTDPLPWIKALPPNFSYKVIPARIAWTQIGLSWEMLKAEPDALLVPSFSMPLIHPKNSIVTIHDVAWHIFPETSPVKQKLWLTFTHRFACRSAKRLIAVSGQTQRDLSERFNVPESKIEVIHHGFSRDSERHMVQNGLDEGAMANEIERINALPKPFVLCLGTIQPRKNLIRLIDAFLKAKSTSNLPHSLVIAGRKGWWCEETLQKIESSPGVTYFDYVLNRFALLCEASLLVQPSIYEGFGLTILDAFAEGVPVACSNISSLPEVAGGAAELFDPYDVDDISSALYRVLSDPGHAAALSTMGLERVKDFTWEECARRTLAVINRSDQN
jgi:glycosyltransferase involved in cell wall biosynthesis